MPKVWQVQEAKARFSEMLDSSMDEGPQIVTKRGVEAAVLVRIDEWRRLRKLARRDVKDLLLATEARTQALAPRRPERSHLEPPPL
ncbi:MAG: type II toxin-antitoxin system Phd/YefM family antitoxin [Gemmatimonadetes bacterium]|nr:type II toxin-antitoxin system Phd/YefM family antitoxin [Gemmatimonadota bacterium]MYA11802.1 type II toxin-antitoxin system Phd/YefM family antitoxin [Gemmatimonadota bacterium]MYE69439.1 type II toxin-antitoxin system Phd/YefM family antitoxin [Gemmatimonadota bacterium]MYJ67949.1 type II toxin-antitoxin system Phd/YefM family antitoxin [Gemmatimonadota bacterium]